MVWYPCPIRPNPPEGELANLNPLKMINKQHRMWEQPLRKMSKLRSSKAGRRILMKGRRAWISRKRRARRAWKQVGKDKIVP